MTIEQELTSHNSGGLKGLAPQYCTGMCRSTSGCYTGARGLTPVIGLGHIDAPRYYTQMKGLTSRYYDDIEGQTLCYYSGVRGLTSHCYTELRALTSRYQTDIEG